jgi:hypothetical protein
MRKELSKTQLTTMAVVALLLAATASCNSSDDADVAETVILPTAISVEGLSVASTADTTATMTLSVMDRNGSSTSFFNDVTFTAYTVTYTPSGLVPDVIGQISTGFCSMGATDCTLTLVMVASASKPAAGTVVFSDVQVEGHDARGRPVSFEANVPLSFTS